MKKTNAMRILDKKKINYNIVEYKVDLDDLSAINVAMKTGQDIDSIYKTIVCLTNTNEYIVACIPGGDELNLKKLAKAARVKKVELIKMSDLEKITGYVRGGCSPIGMKKTFKTFMHIDSIDKKVIYISGGRRGVQVEVEAKSFEKLLKIEFIDIIN